jgi:Pectate lyase superfamily protein
MTRLFPHVINVRARGAKGDGVTDDTAVIQQAMDDLVASSKNGIGGIVLLPPGNYLVSSSLTMMGGIGVAVLGMGEQATSLLPSAGLAGLPILKLVNCVNCSILDLWIQGNASAPPSAGIESRVDPVSSGSSFPENLLVRDVIIGSPQAINPPPAGLQYGVRFTAAAGWDGDNGNSTISHVTIRGLAQVGISIEHSQSLVHNFDSLRIENVPIGIQTMGGSFQLDNSFLGALSDVEFNLLAPNQSDNLQGRPSYGYYHPVLIANTACEGLSDMLRVAEWPIPGTAIADGITGIHVYFTNFGQKGTKPGGTQLDTSIDYQSPGQLSIVSSRLDFGTDTNIVVSNPKSSVTLTGNYISTVHQVHFAGHLTSIGNRWAGGTSILVPGSSAVQNVLGDWIDFPDSTN